jgi:dinuclear metal center YbgI/SA1388 family protein
MVYSIRDIVSYLETIAPPAYQETYDNAQLITGNPEEEVKGILCSLDVTEEVVQEAVENQCNLIVAHHPIIFKGLKSLTGKNHVERTVIKAIKQDVAIYAIHTNLDNMQHGVNKKICNKIGLTHTRILAPKSSSLMKLVTFIPTANTDPVLQALYNAGAGKIGNYSSCSFQVAGTGTFLPSEEASPSIGKREKLESVAENRVEVMFPAYLKDSIVAQLKEAHPYEEVAYYIQTLENENQEIGAGMVGELESSMGETEFLYYLKEKMDLQMVKYTPLRKKKIKKVAVCGGAGVFLLPAAKRARADLFITSDIKYHEFFDAENQIIIADIGHYESEIYTKELLMELLSQKFSNIALYLTKIVTNPITYI